MIGSELTASAISMAPALAEQGGGGGAGGEAPPLVNSAAGGSSPFVRSLADSLVAWQLLDEKSIERARAENKLIFLHVGYQACHFCRLMSVESFSNPECAAILNESFIPIAVDRDERPDIDIIYLNYVQAVSNAGGWPLNVFLTPDLEPVFGGTYWPGPSTARGSADENSDESPDFHKILKKVRNIWRDQEARCRKEAKEVVGQLKEFAAEGTLGSRGIVGTQSIASAGKGAPVAAESGRERKNSTVSSELDLDLLEEAYTHIAGTFDPVYGGFGLAPKFLTPPKLELLLRLVKFPADVQDVVGEAECKYARDMALETLRQISNGALRDHIGGTGFARCSVTPDWSIPNFEKLIVDNALLLLLYLEAWSASGRTPTSEFYNIVLELVEYLTSSPVALPEGGFASSEAADSYNKRGDKDMREGAYYAWTRREFDTVVEEGDKHISLVAAAHWGVLEDGNVDEDHDPNDDFINQNILRVVRTPEDLSKQFNIPVEKVEQYIQTAKSRLKARRDKERARPLLDDKIVTGWNGLVVSALAKTGAALKDLAPEQSEKCLAAAKRAVAFIKEKLWDADQNILYRIWNGGRAVEGFADDYAYLVTGLLDLFGATGDEGLLEFADVLQKTQIPLFSDPAGAFYSTTSTSPYTILRLKDGMDTSLPSTNAVSVSNLFRLGDLLGDDTFTALAGEAINSFEAEMLQHPWLFPGLLAGLVTARLGVESVAVEVQYRTRRVKA